MKKIALVFAAMLFAFSAFAQEQWYVTAGYLHGTSIEKNTNTSNPSNGFYAGVGSEVPIAKNFYLVAEIEYALQTTKDNDSGANEYMHMINVPLRFKYKYPVSPAISIFAQAGVVTSIGLAAYAKVGNTSVDYYGENGILNRLDSKLGIGGGVEIGKKIAIDAGYDWGMWNMSKLPNGNMKIHFLHVGLAYLF